MILIISGTGIISGAEYVLKDFITNSKHTESFYLLSSDIKEVRDFYNEFPIQKSFFTSSLSPVGAKNGNLILKFLKIFKYLKSSYIILNIIKKRKCDIILGNNSGDIIYSFWVKTFSKKKFYLYVHDIIKTDPPLRKLFSYFSKYVDKFLVVSEATKNSLVECNIHPDKIYLVYNGLNINTTAKPKEWTKRSISLGFVGAFIPRKDPMLFVKIIHKITKIPLPVNATLVYNHVDEEYKKKVTSYITDNNLPIKLLGALNRDEMKAYYKDLHFLVVTSKRDPFPTVILEAFNNATPVIGIKNDGIPEMITNNDNGLLFDTESDIEKVINFIKYIDEAKYIQLSSNAQKTIKEKFSIELKVSKLETILELN